MLKGLFKKLAALVSLLMFSAFSWAMSFEADIRFTFNEEEYRGRFRYDGDKVRLDVTDRNGNEGTVIMREDTNTYWLIGPNRTYNELAMAYDIAASTGIIGSHVDPDKVRRHFIGVEKVNGMDVNKYPVILDSYGKQIEFFQWEWPGQPVPLKVASAEGKSVIEYKNVLYRTQKQNCFQLPRGLKKTRFRTSRRKTARV